MQDSKKFLHLTARERSDNACKKLFKLSPNNTEIFLGVVKSRPVKFRKLPFSLGIP